MTRVRTGQVKVSCHVCVPTQIAMLRSSVNRIVQCGDSCSDVNKGYQGLFYHNHVISTSTFMCQYMYTKKSFQTHYLYLYTNWLNVIRDTVISLQPKTGITNPYHTQRPQNFMISRKIF